MLRARQLFVCLVYDAIGITSWGKRSPQAGALAVTQAQTVSRMKWRV